MLFRWVGVQVGGCSGGCVVVFRHEAAHVEPFGMWFVWIIVGGHLVLADLQNSGDAVVNVGIY